MRGLKMVQEESLKGPGGIPKGSMRVSWGIPEDSMRGLRRVQEGYLKGPRGVHEGSMRGP